MDYPKITSFKAFINRPMPMANGVKARLFGGNGPNADAICLLGRSEYQDAKVHVGIFDGEEDIGGFVGYMRRPEPKISGFTAMIYAENGPDADTIAATGVSRFLDKEMTVVISLIELPDGSTAGKKPKGPYSKQSAILYRSSFFRAEMVWKTLFTDEEFIAWLKQQECCVNPNLFTRCEGDVVPMHVRRVANGSGTGIKPPYSAIPGCWKHHQMQHDASEETVGGRQFFEKKRIYYLVVFGWECMRDLMGVESMTHADPVKVTEWARDNGVAQYLPSGYSADSGIK